MAKKLPKLIAFDLEFVPNSFGLTPDSHTTKLYPLALVD